MIASPVFQQGGRIYSEYVCQQKTVEAISASLMASQPELFNLTAGTKPIPGVTVYVAPAAAKAAPAATVTPGYGVQPGAAAPPSAYMPRASATAGLLLVNTNPQRAKVYLDGVYYGLSPLRLEMEPGVHAISVKLEGYKMVTEKVSVRKGDNTEMELNLSVDFIVCQNAKPALRLLFFQVYRSVGSMPVLPNPPPPRSLGILHDIELRAASAHHQLRHVPSASA